MICLYVTVKAAVCVLSASVCVCSYLCFSGPAAVTSIRSPPPHAPSVAHCVCVIFPKPTYTLKRRCIMCLNATLHLRLLSLSLIQNFTFTPLRKPFEEIFLLEQ